ncbi:right-handed parallel beta-helix repeat-containing protein [Streptosporangium sp. NPDC051023]|uniref:right-handed parallel beta-helix repeat-containing protein n=1 Tax=Streptosporangium sp. NPDC051023 TaxID=3155410 RepID=UPI00344FB494
MNYVKETRRRHLGKTCAALTLTLLATLAAPSPASASSAEVGCGTVVTSDVTLTEDLNCTPGGALTIGADNVTVDLNGHTISGESSTGVSVLRHTGVTVRNGTIGSGVRVDLNSSLTLSRVKLTSGATVDRDSSLTVTGTLSSCRVGGLSLSNRSTLTMERCTTYGTIVASDTHNSTVKWSEIHSALTLSGGGSNAFTGNVFDGAWTTLKDGSNDNLFADNTFQNSIVAFTAGASQGAPNKVEDNTFKNNDLGMLFGPAFNNISIRDNLFQGNSTAGIYVNTGSPVITNSYPVADNVFEGNGLNPSGIVDRAGNTVQGGLYFHSRYWQGTLTHNTGSGNGGFLIWAPTGLVTDGGNNQGPCGPNGNSALTCS